MMTQTIRDAVYTIPVPTDLNAAVLAACRAEVAAGVQPAPGKILRFVPAVATAAACVAVLGVALYATGHNPGGAPVVPPVGDDSGTVTTATTDGDVEQTTTTATTTTTTTTATTTTTTTNTTKNHTTPPKSTIKPTSKTIKPTTTCKCDPDFTTRTTKALPSTVPSTTVAHTTRPSVGGTPTKEAGILKVSIFQEMTVAELEAYYGQKVIPAWLPEGLELRLDPDKRLGVCRKDEALIAENQAIWNNLLGDGIARDAEVVYDHNQLRWCDFIDGRRELLVHVATAPYPRYRLGDTTRFDDPITVAGTTVMAAYFEDSADCWCWSVLLAKGDTEYYIEGWNITETEFVQMLESLIA